MAKARKKPVGIMQLLQMFSTESKSIRWLERVRWNGRPTCPRCKSSRGVSKGKGG